MTFFYNTENYFTTVQAVFIILIMLIAYSLDKNCYINIGVASSFLFSGYRPLLQVLSCIGLQFLALAVVFLLKVAINEHHTDMSIENISMGSFLIIEFLCGFFISFYYYSLLVDFRSIKEGAATVAGISLIYGGVQIAFPKYPAGKTLLAIVNFSTIQPAIISFIGNVFGALLGSMVYKFVICENNDLKNKEIQANENNQQVDF